MAISQQHTSTNHLPIEMFGLHHLFEINYRGKCAHVAWIDPFWFSKYSIRIQSKRMESIESRNNSKQFQIMSQMHRNTFLIRPKSSILPRHYIFGWVRGLNLISNAFFDSNWNIFFVNQMKFSYKFTKFCYSSYRWIWITISK